MMRYRYKKILPAVVVLLFLSVAASRLFYTPPLLGSRWYNLPGRVYDFFAHVYYSTRSDWLKSGGQEVASRRASARAAWHRPSWSRELLGIGPEDSLGLAREYAALGLNYEAARLFQKALPDVLSDEDKSLEIVSYLAFFDQWSDVARVAEKLLNVTPRLPEANYWYGRALLETGRPGEALEYLEKAVGHAPFRIDARYQAARSAEKLNQKNSARSRYEEVVAEMPGHREAWKALDRLYGAGGEATRQKFARRRWTGLTPAIPLEVHSRNRFILRGYSLSPGDVPTGGKIALALFLEGWDSGSAPVRPEAVLISRACPQRISRKGDAVAVPATGEVAVSVFEWALPSVLYPGRVDLEISFTDPESGVPLRLNGAESLPIGSFLLTPAWMAAPGQPDRINQQFGPDAWALGKTTFLGPGSELDYVLDREERAAAIGLISYAHTSGSLPQDSVLAQIVVQTAEEGEIVFPVRVGSETAEVWWEYYPAGYRRHRQAPIFNSWPVHSGEQSFQAHEYWAVFPFSGPATIRSLRLRNMTRRSGIHVGDIILIPPRAKDVTAVEQ
ncbi:MAG: tetratricopeptide repeat protein [PVC group bacterium]